MRVLCSGGAHGLEVAAQAAGAGRQVARVLRVTGQAEVWGSGYDARAHAEQSSPFLAGAELPAPSRVFGFEVTSYVVS